ncbi:MAG: hypothetical protein QNJ63_04605 [Calothrix sp. MO_192.B10]|nr:hypothetical protein [Calothrix sp. MO_192.B10]
MNKQNYPLELKFYIYSRKLLRKIVLLINACFIGFWLGILRRDSLHSIDQLYYDNTQQYRNEEYNRGGLWHWETKILNKYFQQCNSLLVAGVGGGREVLALRILGYEVDGFECNPQLVDFANKLLEKEGLPANVQLVPRDECPDNHKQYDGIIVGWGAYMLIQGRENRINFLKKLHSQAKDNSPILISFFDNSDSQGYFQVVVKIGNVIRRILRRDFLEFGDDLVPNYVHHFTKEEIATELKAGGFELEMYSTNEYGHAVGIANPNLSLKSELKSPQIVAI